MKKNLYTKISKLFLLSIFLLFAFAPEASNSFEGVISYRKATMTDTTHLEYYMKGEKVRINKLDSKGKISQFTIVDFKNNQQIVLNPSLKMYVIKDLQLSPLPDNDAVSVDKTENYKYIQGYKCFQWLVRCKERNAVVSFWVADEHFDLYNDLLKSIDETEKISGFYSYIPKSGGFIPLQSVERSWLRDTRMELLAEKILKTQLKDSYFDIPSTYKVFE